jgi:hypothetical protein
MTIADAVRPSRHAAGLRERPRWVGRFTVLAALYIVLGVAGGVHRASVTAYHLPRSVTVEERAAARDAILDATVVRSLFLPVRLFTGWSAFALLLWYACRIWSTRETVRYVHILAAEVHAEGALLLGNAAALAAAFFGGAAGAHSAGWVPGGLDLIVPAGDFTSHYILNALNIFSALYVALLSVTLSVILGISRIRALVSVLVAWGLSLLFNATVFELLRREFQFAL